MRILMLESEPGIARDHEARLTEAGHEVVRCHEPGAPSFPCAGLPDVSGCPLEQQAVDVALLVRDPIDERPTHREAGVACALRARVPVLQPAGQSTEPFAGHVSTFDGDIVEALALAADGGGEGHAQAVHEHLVATAAAEGVDASAIRVRARREGRRLALVVDVPAGHERLVTAAKGWAGAAARRYDPALQVIDVTVEQV
jgi:hypothetical protein